MVDVVCVNYVGLESFKLLADLRKCAGVEHTEVVAESLRIARIDSGDPYAVNVLAAGVAGILHGGHNEYAVSLR